MVVPLSSKSPAASLAAALLAAAALSAASSWSAGAQEAETFNITEGGVVNVVDVSLLEQGVCALISRTFRAYITTVCPLGAFGYLLAYGIGAVGGDIVVTSCPDDRFLTLCTLGGTAGLTPFEAQETAFLDKIAADIEENPTDDLDEPGSLEALSVLTFRTLAAWPPDSFPIKGN